MKTFTRRLFILVLFIGCSWGGMFADNKTVNSITITQVDTFALQGMAAQPVLKININVTGTDGSLSFQKLLVHTLNDNNTDVDSVALYYSDINNRFSLVDYPGEAFLLGHRQKIAGDTAAFHIAYNLQTGDNYFWVTMDLNSGSRASHVLRAYVPANGITIASTFYPPTQSTTANDTIAQIYFRDNFENYTIGTRSLMYPVGWDQSPTPNNTYFSWHNNNGGYSISTVGYPAAAKSGQYNLLINKVGYQPDSTVLYKQIDLSLASHPKITFYHAQAAWCKDIACADKNSDKLRVKYKIGLTGAWHEIAMYRLETDDWTKREIFLPTAACVSNCILGFEGIVQFGWGVVVDSLIIYETHTINKGVHDVAITQPNLEMIPQGASKNPILRMNIRVKGNTGNVILNSINVTSGNTLDTDIAPGGVKLYYTPDSIFVDPVQLGSGLNFSGGVAFFTGLNKLLETGENFIWVTYDVKATAYPGHALDASIGAGGIGSTQGNYPSTDAEGTPDGSRIVKQTVFFDDFESLDWITSGEFQIGPPQGKGGTHFGMPDPTSAYSGSWVLGTDLTGITPNAGDYEPNLVADAYTATSPLIDGRYFKNIQFDFFRYLNVDNTDSASIEYQIFNETAWHKLWTSKKKYVESKWRTQSVSTNQLFDRKKFKIRFALGPTDNIDNYSGWNIDYLFLTGDSIPIDVAMGKLVSPISSCDLKANEHIKVYVKNVGPNPLINTPIRLSIDGGNSYVTETIPGPVLPDDSTLYTFTHASDFSKASNYKIIVRAFHPRDNFPENDSIIQNVASYPTYTLPYHTGFEEDTSYWHSGGINNSWALGKPNGAFISQPYKGQNCWKTDFSGYHLLEENSYVESPCFTFTGSTYPIMDVAFDYAAKDLVDGAILQYSTDQGKTWVYADEDAYPFKWNWYNNNVGTLGSKGWTGRSLDKEGDQEWKYGRQLLPPALAGEDTVKFRFAFKSDPSTTVRSEGFAFDELTLQEAPFDVGVSSIDNVVNPSCQVDFPKLLNVHIKNYGVRDLQVNDTMIVGVRVNRGVTVIDTFKLTQAIPAGTSIPVTLHKKIDLTPPGNDTVFVFTMIEKNPFFYDSICNDTISLPYFSKVNPVIGLPDSLFNARLDTVSLTPNCSGYTYHWLFEGVDSYNCIMSKPLNPGWYNVTATSVANGCFTKDSIYLKTLIPNVGISQILAPITDCGYGIAMHPIVRISNNGTDTISISRKIPVSLKLTNVTTGISVVRSEQVPLLSKLAPNSFYDAILTSTLDMSEPDNYKIWACTGLLGDTARGNDTAKLTFNIWGYPHVDLGPDMKVNAYKDTLYAGPGFGSYMWNDGSTNDSLIISTYGDYSVTVTDNAGHGCMDVDTVHMSLTVHDVGIKRIVSPVNACTLTNQTTVTLEIQNFGTDTIRSTDTITLTYQLTNGATVTSATRKLSLASLLPGDSVAYTFNQKVDMHIPVAYNFQASTYVKNDLNATNDAITTVINVWGIPPVSLGSSQIIQDKTEYPLDPGPGYMNYLWQDSSTNEVFTITQANARENGDYSVTVTDSHGCKNSSSVVIYLEILDFQVTSILSPLVPTCTNPNPVNVSVRITNSGNQATDASFPPIKIYYRINNNPEIGKQFVFDKGVGESMDYTFNDLITLNNPETDTLKVRIDPTGDLRTANNSLTQVLNVFVTPTVDLGPDTLVTGLPHMLNAGAGAGFTYLWSSGENTQTIQAANDNIKYYVTVTSSDGCKQSDSIVLIQSSYDLKVSGFGLPSAMCAKSSQAVSFDIANSGTMPFTNQPVTISYQLNNGTPVTKSVTFTGAPLSITTFSFDSPIDMSTPGAYNFTVNLTCAQDGYATNNSATYPVTVSVKPVVNLGGVRDTLATTLPTMLDAGMVTNYTYLWQDGTTAPALSVPVQTAAWYKVTVTNQGCWTKDSVFVKEGTGSGISQVGDKATLSVFPNPASDVIYVNLSLKGMDDVVLEIISSDGRMVKNLKLTGRTQYMETIDVSSLPKGLYYIRVYHKDWVVTEKELIQ